MNPTSRLIATLKTLLLVAAPFLWAGASYQLALNFLPGEIKLHHWRLSAVLASLLSASGVLWLLWKSRVKAFGKAAISCLVVSVFGFFAVGFSMRSNCESDQVHIGKKSVQLQVASCQ
jgi:hypothetical protein